MVLITWQVLGRQSVLSGKALLNKTTQVQTHTWPGQLLLESRMSAGNCIQHALPWLNLTLTFNKYVILVFIMIIIITIIIITNITNIGLS